MTPTSGLESAAQFIGGEWFTGEGERRTSFSPVNGSAVWTGRDASPRQVAAAVDAASASFSAWRGTTTTQRDLIVRRFAELLGEHRTELAALITAEVGKTRADADSEVAAMIGKAELSIAARDERTGTSHRDIAAGTLEISHRPLGPMIVLGPFNFPGHLPNGHITPAVLAGNTVVFKPSELAPAVAQRTIEIWEAAGLPAGVINLVTGGVEVAEALIDHQATAGVLFTGGVDAGRAIHRRLAGRPEVMLALELGGNNPLIAWSVGDPLSAATTIVRSAYLSSGQRCTCARRLIVADDPQGQAVVDAVVDLAGRITVGVPAGFDDNDRPDPFMGPVVSSVAASRVLEAQQRLVDRGAVALLASAPGGDGPAFVTPGVLDVTSVVDRPDEEIFGPLLQVIRVATIDDAILEANNTAFGLAAGVVTDDDGLWGQALDALDAGIINRNLPTVGASGAAPFGGTGASGNHRPAGYTAADYCATSVASLERPAGADVAPISEVVGHPIG